MKFAVLGLGSMGKRRIRNLIANKQTDIIGFDIREDRREETKEKFNIEVYEDFEKMTSQNKIDAFVISLPPDLHMKYAHYAMDNNIHSFIEASVLEEDMNELLEKMKKKPDIEVCPSCTLRHHPAIKKIKEIVEDNLIGKLSNFTYHSGQYLPDWHPWEDINEFYVSKKETGGCREIVPFELTWMNWVFGDIEYICGFNEKTIELNADIDDTYVSAIKYKNGMIGSLLVDVVSRQAVRKLVLNGQEGQVLWDWDKKQVELYTAKDKRWTIYKDPEGQAAAGYNQNIIEEMYILEIRNFINAIKKEEKFINTIEDDLKVLHCLYGVEKANKSKAYTKL